MLTGKPADLPAGGACAFQLPDNPTVASQARSLLATTMRELGFSTDPIEDAKLAVSELATNAHTHASAATRPELWLWARTHPTPELVVSIFDAHRASWPVMSDADPMDESGKGLSIVQALSADTGTHPTRSRLTAAPGKCVYFTSALPIPWPPTDRTIAPRTAANQLTATLHARGIPTTCGSDESGFPVLTAGSLNIRAEPNAFTWRDDPNDIRQPLIDLEEAAERIVRRHEAHPSASPV